MVGKLTTTTSPNTVGDLIKVLKRLPQNSLIQTFDISSSNEKREAKTVIDRISPNAQNPASVVVIK
jgi:hypothetical protein